jgi:hypothetical protein
MIDWRSSVISERSLFGIEGALAARVLAVVVILLCLFGQGIPAAGQALGGLTGTVTDSTGAVIPGAQIEVTNESTGVLTKATSTQAGAFSVTALAPGNYTLRVTAPGFSTSLQHKVLVDVASTSTLTITLAAGQTSETVQVSSPQIALETEEPQIGTTLEPEVLNALPIEVSGNARQIDQFLFLSPGVQGSAFSHTIGGGVNFEEEIVFNGIPVVLPNLEGTQTYVNPPFELVNEFKVQRSTFSAQYGIGQAAVTYNMVSGTNKLHGDVFEINRNSFFDSDGFVGTNFNAEGKPIPPVNHENNYGFKIGGPVVIPRVYDGRNRTFFLFTSDWFQQKQPLTGIGTVPTAAMKTGDFSGFVDSTGNVIPIYDPLTGMPFPGNKIDPSRFSPLSMSILQYIPNPDYQGTNFGLQSNKLPSVKSTPIKENLYGFTVDHKLTEMQSVHFTMWRDNQLTQPFNDNPIVPFGNPLLNATNNYNFATGFLLNYVDVVKPNLVATAGASWVGKLDGQQNASQKAPFPAVANSVVYPHISFDGQNAITGWGNAETGNTDYQLGIAIVNNWLWTKGRHTLNIGGEFRRAYEDQQSCNSCAGNFGFSANQTSDPNTSDPNFGRDGSSFASFLLGLGSSASRSYAPEVRFRNVSLSPYFQDDFRITPKLTLNAGLRWDILVPFTEVNNQVLFVNPTAPNPGAGNIPGALTKFGDCVGCAGYTRANTRFGDFGPRFGIGYAFNSKNYFQAGVFMTYLQGGAYEFGTANAINMASLLAGSFNQSATGSSVPGYGDWDVRTMPSPAATPFSPSLGIGNGVYSFNRNLGRAPYEQAWSANYQRELPWNQLLTLSYIANHGVHLPSGLNPLDQPNPSILQYGSVLNDLITSPQAAAAGLTTPYANFVSNYGSSATVFQALRPFPQYTSVQNLYDDAGSSSYESFQPQIQKRFTNGLSYLGSLTLARDLTNSDRSFSASFSTPLNKYNQYPEYTVSSNDQKYIVRIVGTYDIPVGKGQAYFNNSGFTGELLGGWQMSAILDYEGGTPFGPYESYQGLNGFDRPNYVPGVKVRTLNYGEVNDFLTGKRSTNPVIITANAFTPTPNQYVLGDSVRNYAGLRNPPLRTESFSLLKFFSISEYAKLSLRVDYFNAFNRVQVGSPDTNILDSTFGQVTSAGSNLMNRQGQMTARIEF